MIDDHKSRVSSKPITRANSVAAQFPLPALRCGCELHADDPYNAGRAARPYLWGSRSWRTALAALGPSQPPSATPATLHLTRLPKQKFYVPQDIYPHVARLTLRSPATHNHKDIWTTPRHWGADTMISRRGFRGATLAAMGPVLMGNVTMANVVSPSAGTATGRLTPTEQLMSTRPH